VPPAGKPAWILGFRPKRTNLHEKYDYPSLRVLVVDDSPINREVLRALLTRWGHEVEEAADGVMAVAAIQRQGPDLVLMDLDMPGMDGLEATRRVRATEGQGPRLPIVALTGKAFADDLVRTREAGMDAHLVKPVQLEALQRVLAQTVSVSRGSPAEW
jgi:CheY-like chemotaxis protein